MITAVVLLTFGFSQSIYNAIGLGLYSGYGDASAQGTGSLGLIPSYSKNLALGNPSTWHNSYFAMLVGSASNHVITTTETDIANSHFDIGPVQLILPIAGKYAWGLAIRPITNNYYDLYTDIDDLSFFDDTVSVNYSKNGAGGISLLQTAIGFPLTAKENQAVQLDVLFGSSRHSSILGLDDEDYYYSRHDSYSGLNLKYYLTSQRFTIIDRPLSLFFSFGVTLQPFKVRSIQYHLYEDSDDSEYYDDYYDYPYIESSEMEETVVLEKALSSSDFSLGFSYNLAALTELQGEVYRQLNSGSLPGVLQTINGYYYGDITHFNLGVVKYAKPLSRSTWNKLTFRSGIYFDSWEIYPFDENLTEKGLTCGLGYIFGFSNNSINLTYSIGNRNGPVLAESETVGKLGIQFVIGDTWFVKRRKR